MKNQVTMMHQVAFFAVCASFLVLAVSGDADVSVCRHPAPVETFTASVYTAQIVSNDQNFIHNFSMDGGEAGIHMSRVVKKIFSEAKLCNADEIAFIAGHGVAKAGLLTLPLFFKNTAYTVGEALYKGGVLHCASAINLALEYFGYIEKESEGLDKTQFDTYIIGVLKGYEDMIANHSLDLAPVTTDSVNIFSSTFDDGNKTKCPFDAPMNHSKLLIRRVRKKKGPK